MSGVWIGDPQMSPVRGSLGIFVLKTPLKFMDGRGDVWVVPEGTTSNLSDFPWFLRPFVKTTKLVWSPFLHDYLYEEQPNDPRSGKRVTRKKADSLYRDGALAEGMAEHLAEKLYGGLRVGGWVGWNKYARRLK